MKVAKSSAVARLALTSAACSALLFSAQAQDQAPPAEGDTATGVEEIIVTADKRKTQLQKTPSAITAFSSARLETQNITGVKELQFSVPSMVFGDQSGYSFISIRGIGTDVTTTSAEPAVATYADGVYTGSLITQSLPAFDLERIEILRGPQGTLYGRNATGGVINYISKAPSYDEAFNLAVTVGSYGRQAVDASVTGPLVEDKLAYRVGVHAESRDGYRKNIALGINEYDLDEWSGRGALLFEPNEDLSITLRGDYLDQKTSASYMLISTQAIPAVAGALDLMVSPTLPLGIFSQPASFFQANPFFLSPSDIALLKGGSIAEYLDLLSQPGPIAPGPDDSLKFSDQIPSRYDVKTGGASMTVEWDIGNVTLKSITAYRHGELSFDQDSTGFGTPQVVFYPLRQENDQWTQEFNLSGTAFDDKLDWLVGAFYFHDDATFNTTVWLPGIGEYVQAFSSLADADGPYVFNLSQPLVPFYQLFPGIEGTVTQSGPDYILGGSVIRDVTNPSTAFLGFGLTQESKSYAGFGQATYKLTDALRLTGGLRYTVDEKNVVRSKHSNLLLFFGGGNPAAVDLCDKEPEGKKWYALTGTAGVDYDVAEKTLIYAKYSKGYKAGGFNPGECHGAFDPEKLDAFEAGVKSIFGEGQFSFNAAGFYYDYTDIQFTTFVPGASSIKNAGAAEVYGIEVEFQALPDFLPGLALDGSMSWVHSEYTEGNPDRADGLFFDVTNRDLLDIRGNNLIRSPEWKFSLGAQYGIDMGSTGALTLRGEASWTDTIYNDIFNGAATFQGATTQPAYWLLNARAIWDIDDGKYQIQLFGENLTNEYYAVNRVAFNTPTTLVSVGGQYAAPRTFGLRVSMKLDNF